MNGNALTKIICHLTNAKIFNEYFAVFPWKLINNKSIGADIGCGSGRWALEIAHRVGKLYLIDASNNALNVARKKI